MANLPDMLWIEWRKAWRSRMPLWTGLGSLALPLGLAFLVFVSRNQALSQKLGLVGAKANLATFAAVDWPTYLSAYGQLIAAAGFILFVLVVSWVFGRELVDGTAKDWLAVPVPRVVILSAKFAVAAAWALGLAVVIFVSGLAIGVLLQLPAASAGAFERGTVVAAVAAGLTIVLALPFAFFASVGRGYLLPIGLAMLTLLVTNLAVVLGRGEYWPWTVAGLYAQGQVALGPVSFALVFIAGAVGVAATLWWWQRADQNR